MLENKVLGLLEIRPPMCQKRSTHCQKSPIKVPYTITPDSPVLAVPAAAHAHLLKKQKCSQRQLDGVFYHSTFSGKLKQVDKTSCSLIERHMVRLSVMI